MRTIFVMNARQTGKTYKAIEDYKSSPDNTLYVVCNEKHIRNIRYSNVIDNIVSSSNSLRFYQRFKNIILDDYMLFNNKKEIYLKIKNINPDYLLIYTSSDRQYNKEIFNFVKDNKRRGLNWILEQYEDKSDKQEIEDLYYNFITDEETELFVSVIGDINNKNHLKNNIVSERFETEILNNWLK